MTLGEKQLLIKDLCARLPYGVKIWVKWDKNPSPLTTSILGNYWHTVGDDIKPYLRPLSSMTEEEADEYDSLNAYESGVFPHTEEAFDWLNKNHFDYRGLIPIGLALETKEGVYKTE